MTNFDVVKKLIGEVRPVGESNEDESRLKNLGVLCELFDQIHTEIDSIAYDFEASHEASIKKACELANKQLNKFSDPEGNAAYLFEVLSSLRHNNVEFGLDSQSRRILRLDSKEWDSINKALSHARK
jgi:hypothetical protein